MTASALAAPGRVQDEHAARENATAQTMFCSTEGDSVRGEAHTVPTLCRGARYRDTQLCWPDRKYSLVACLSDTDEHAIPEHATA